MNPHPHTDIAGDEPGPSLRDAIREAERAVRRVLSSAVDQGRARQGELGGLLELLDLLDAGQAAAVELVDQAERASLAERHAALPLEGLLALRTRATVGDRRTLLAAAETLRGLPNVRARFHEGMLGWAQIRHIVAAARSLPADARARLDAGFAETARLARMDADTLLGLVDEAVLELTPIRETDRDTRRFERRYLHAQLGVDGSVAGTFELDAESAAPVLAAIEQAAPPPSAGPRDASRDAVGDDPDHGTDHEAAASDPDDDAPAFADPVVDRTRARQRADGLVRLAETWLAGEDGGRRARPRLQAVCDLEQLTGAGPGPVAARALLATIAGRWTLTPAALRRLADDADLQVVLHHHGEILGVSEPTPTIPTSVRAAVASRDQGCRFPGCAAPILWCDLHHVVAREDEGSTTTDNLVALCRRHHTTVTNRHWRLTMTLNGTVTVKRGRHTATSDPPLRQHLLAA